MYCGSQRHLPGEQLVVQGVWNHLQARLVVSHQLDQFVLVHEALLGLLEHLEGQVLQVSGVNILKKINKNCPMAELDNSNTAGLLYT